MHLFNILSLFDFFASTPTSDVIIFAFTEPGACCLVLLPSYHFCYITFFSFLTVFHFQPCFFPSGLPNWIRSMDHLAQYPLSDISPSSGCSEEDAKLLNEAEWDSYLHHASCSQSNREIPALYKRLCTKPAFGIDTNKHSDHHNPKHLILIHNWRCALSLFLNLD